MVGVLIEKESDERLLADLGAKDSKLLTPEKREELYPQIIKLIKSYKVVMLQPQEIDAAVQSSTLNLNWLEANHSAEIVNFLKPKKAIIDCPSPNIPAYHRYLKSKLTTETELILEHKAESHPVVAAASIIAKVTRDREIEKIKKEIGHDFGSGYTSDEITVNFLKKYHAQYPELFRKTWAPYKKVFQKSLGEF